MTTDPADPEIRRHAAEGRERAVWEALDGVEDPELPISIVDLGLIYDVNVTGSTAEIELTLTYSGCPGKEMIRRDTVTAVRDVEGIEDVDIDVVYSPPWTVDRITDSGREALSEFGLAVPGDDSQPEPDCRE